MITLTLNRDKYWGCNFCRKRPERGAEYVLSSDHDSCTLRVSICQDCLSHLMSIKVGDEIVGTNHDGHDI